MISKLEKLFLLLKSQGGHMSFGKKLKKLREEKKITQEELANILGLTGKTISNYEVKGLKPRKIEIYEKLADFFEIDINYLLTPQDCFIINTSEKFGYKSAKDALHLVENMAGLFAGGELPEEDKDILFEAISEAYWQAKIENRKYAKIKKR